MKRDLETLRALPDEPKPNAVQIFIGACLAFIGLCLLIALNITVFSLWPYLR